MASVQGIAQAVSGLVAKVNGHQLLLEDLRKVSSPDISVARGLDETRVRQIVDETFEYMREEIRNDFARDRARGLETTTRMYVSEGLSPLEEKVKALSQRVTDIERRLDEPGFPGGLQASADVAKQDRHHTGDQHWDNTGDQHRDNTGDQHRDNTGDKHRDSSERSERVERSGPADPPRRSRRRQKDTEPAEIASLTI